MRPLFVSYFVFLSLFLLFLPCIASASAPPQPPEPRPLLHLAPGAGRVPIASGDRPGFLPGDARRVTVVTDPERAGDPFVRLTLAPRGRSVYLQYGPRRRYLATGTEDYRPGSYNVLSFRLRVPEGSRLLCGEGRGGLGVWTYHWRPGDLWVGGRWNNSGTTDSMMHGYASLCLEGGRAGEWVRVELAESAFQKQRDYYHFYAARGVTGDLELFPSLRQLQFVPLGPFEGLQTVDLGELELLRRDPTARFEPAFARVEVPAGDREVRIPVTLVNPTDRARRYRVFVSSALGAGRDALNRAFAEADHHGAPAAVQAAVDAGGGLGVADLVPVGGGAGVGESALPVEVPAGGRWEGFLVHRVKAQMLGGTARAAYRGRTWEVRRDTLTTSVIAWDPDEPRSADAVSLSNAGSNADDGVHRPPPGFPRQRARPPGWGSRDVPLEQVGGYMVTEIVLN
ncbi:MAG: hypothetical protein ACNA8S_14685 [Deferrisomatales bacterium]